MANTLVLGGGFEGSSLCKALVKGGHNVYSLDNYDNSRPMLEENYYNDIEYTNGASKDIAKLYNYPDLKFDYVFYQDDTLNNICNEVLNFVKKHNAELIGY